ncbi:hypothetical protein, partial [Shewanella sp. SG41-4]|uniref:hypothetical protein n=1 Tax=Shewanella sp. SG41-4 TaxID=2760976 RepID=UPI001C7239C6
TARTQADAERITAKYSYLFDDNRPATKIVLSFTEDGNMLVGVRNVSLANQLAGNFWPSL